MSIYAPLKTAFSMYIFHFALTTQFILLLKRFYG